MSLANLLTQTCQVQKVSTSKAATGGVINTFTDRIASAPCLLNQRQRIASSEGGDFGKVTFVDENFLFMNAAGSALSIVPSDRIIISSNQYEVVNKPYNVGNRSVLLKISVTEIEI